MKAYYLTISSYSGIVAGAYHLHARVRWTDRAQRYNIGEADIERWYWYEAAGGTKVRMQTGAFENRVSLMRAARKWFENKVGNDPALLVEGSISHIDPKHVLLGPRECKIQLNRLWREYERLGGSDNRDREVDVKAVCDRWDVIWKKLVDT